MKKEKSEGMDMSVPSNSDYPYGLKICIDYESMEKLGIKELPAVGATMKIQAVVEVCGISMHETKDHECKSIDLQIVEMGVEGKKVDVAKKLYGED